MMIYESQKKRKAVFKKLSKAMDDEEVEEKPEDMNTPEFGGDLDEVDAMPMSGRSGHRDQTKDDPFVTEGLEDRLCAILETFKQRNVKPHDNSKGAGALGQGPSAPSPVSKVPVIGHAAKKEGGKTEQSRRRGALDVNQASGETEEKEEDDDIEGDELDKLKKDLGMGDPDASE
tara:strand:+ start:15692 stop:16213 length:522 start_codon:yes stop_codon:yes gene_type:complete